MQNESIEHRFSPKIFDSWEPQWMVLELEGRHVEIMLYRHRARPEGRYEALMHPRQEGWPRFYFSLQSAQQEAISWLRANNEMLPSTGWRPVTKTEIKTRAHAAGRKA